MKAQAMNLIYSSSIDKIVEGNSSFDRGLLRVCYWGKNRNGSSISKEAFERCIESIYNVPVVCRYDRDADEIGSHDMELVENRDGQLSLVNLTQPVGVVPESANYFWETVEEEDGTTHEYLCVEVLLWKRQEAYEKIKENGITDESMEISVLEGHIKDGIYVIERFEFAAFCLLGTAEPCYESASLLTFAEDNFRKQYHAMMKELKETYQLAAKSGAGTDTTNYSEGGDKTLDQEKMELLAKYNLTAEQLEFDASSMSYDELKAELEQKFADAGNGAGSDPAEPDNGGGSDNGGEPSDGNGGGSDSEDGSASDNEEDADEQFALASQLFDGIVEALGSEKMETAWGESARYWYVDHDDEKAEVYAYDGNDWKLYGFSYAKNGDNVVVDFESKKRVKFAIVEFDEGEQPSVAGSMFAAFSSQYEAREKAWNEKFEAYTKEIAELQEFKKNAEAQIENEKFEAECNGVFDHFTSLNGNEAFEALRGDHAGFTVEQIEEKCFAILGRMQESKFSAHEPSAKAPKLPIESTSTSEAAPYGGLFAEFGIASD